MKLSVTRSPAGRAADGGRDASRSYLALLLLLAPVASAQGQGVFSGTWTIRSWQPAPWLEAAEAKAIKAERGMIGAHVTFSKARVTGPRILSCDTPVYEIKDVPFDGLFEGGLTKPAEQGAALGFRGLVTTLAPGCEFEFHQRDASTALFAMSNVVYVMVRQGASK